MFNRKKYVFLTILLLLILSPVVIKAQEYADKNYYLIDSLNIENLIDSEKEMINTSLDQYHKAPTEKERLEAINSIVENTWNNEIWHPYNQWIYDYTKGKIGNLSDNFNKADLSEEEKIFFKYYSNAVNNIGIINHDIGDLSKGLSYYYKSLTIREKLNDSTGLSESYNNIGSVYNSQGLFEKALEYNERSLAISTKINDKRSVPVMLNNIGNLHYSLGDKKKALESYNKALLVSKEVNDIVGEGMALNNIGSIYENEEDFDKALEYYEKSLKIVEGNRVQIALIASLINVASIYLKKGSYSKAREFAEKGLQEAKKDQNPESVMRASSMLSSIYQKENNWQKAFSMQELYFKMRDSIENSEIEKSIIQQKATYDLNKKQQEIELLSAKNEIQELRLAKNKNSIILISIVLFFALVTTFVSFRGFKKKQYINKLLERQKGEISRQNEAKKTMLQEIHHRVKNNLQVVNSLLRMQSSKMVDVKVINMFKETQSRVRSMAKLHEKMYQSGDLKELNAKEHITMLVEELVKNYSLSTKVNLDLDIETIYIDAETMMPLSLIINEMVANSLKYAFSGREKGLITLKFNKINGVNQLIVSDDGVGYRRESTNKGLGSRLIESFTKQLNGTLKEIESNGTAYMVQF